MCWQQDAYFFKNLLFTGIDKLRFGKGIYGYEHIVFLLEIGLVMAAEKF